MREEESIFEVDHICLEAGDFSLKDISFVLRKGYITGLVGANGSGKSTLIKAISEKTVCGWDWICDGRSSLFSRFHEYLGSFRCDQTVV